MNFNIIEQTGRLARPLPASFYCGSASDVAPALLGHWLFRRLPGGFAGGPIVEVEAYVQGDEACHAFRGPTPRNEVMFGPPGVAYVYFIYGCHYCVNTVCMPKSFGEAVLIRAIEPRLGLNLMQKLRPVQERHLTNGPGKLCAALAIDRDLNGANLSDSEGPLFIAEDSRRAAMLKALGPIVASTRIGIKKDAHLPLRFSLSNSQYLSRPASPGQAGRKG